MVYLIDANPLASCTAGGNGRSIMMFSNQPIPNDVSPVFQVYVNGNHRPDLDRHLKQPVREQIDQWPSSVMKFSRA